MFKIDFYVLIVKEGHVIKFGFYNGIQRYKCKNKECGKTFNSNKNNPFRYSKKFKKMWEKYFEVFIQGCIFKRMCS